MIELGVTWRLGVLAAKKNSHKGAKAQRVIRKFKFD